MVFWGWVQVFGLVITSVAHLETSHSDWIQGRSREWNMDYLEASRGAASLDLPSHHSSRAFYNLHLENIRQGASPSTVLLYCGIEYH